MQQLKRYYTICKINDQDCVDIIRGTASLTIDGSWSLLIGYSNLKNNKKYWESDKQRYMAQGYFCEEMNVNPELSL